MFSDSITSTPVRDGRVRLLVAVIALAGAAASVIAGPAQHAQAGSEASQDLARVRRATNQFHSVEAAEAAGYVGAGQPCVEAPGVGAMGIHYVNFDLMRDPSVDLARPEVLLYMDQGNELRLVGVEYLAVDADQDLGTSDDRPFLFGRGFHGPMPGHGPGMPVHYDLHVWTWQGNPAGVFTQWNSSLSCP